MSDVAVITIPATEWNETRTMIRNLCEQVNSLTHQEQKELLTPKEVCEMLKIGRTTYERYAANGIFEVIQLSPQKSSRKYVKRAEIERLISEGRI